MQDLWIDAPAFLIVMTALLGLAMGSFLNVVVHRLPRMLERQWRRECLLFLGQPAETASDAKDPGNLFWPGSRCAACRTPLRAAENIPLLGYLWLRGRCAHCGTEISPRYPLLELLSAVLSAAVAWRFGWSLPLLPALVLSWGLLALAAIDLERQLLPDAITLPFLWLGLLLSLFGVFTDSPASILGAVSGYLSLWLVYQLFRLLTGREGMGYGDFKLLALLGAWLGWGVLPSIIILSSGVGAVAGLLLIGFGGRDRHQPIPFGPYLAAAGWLVLLFGDAINTTYLAWIAPV